ncbi:MAG: hypothetical protein OIF57_12020 [Marinobacterium sp.]|nr:hypothetical protein [Marinobacterium sp.]
MADFSQQMDAWFQAQQQFWQQMLTAGPLYSATTIEMPQLMAELAQQLRYSSDGFQHYGEQLLAQLQAGQPTQAVLDQFICYIQQQQNTLIMRRWQLPEALITLYSQLNPGQLSLDQLHNAPAEPFIQGLKNLLSMPLPGLSSQQQAVLQEGKMLLEHYQQALNDYLQLYNGLTLTARDQLHARLQQEPVESLQALHDMWTDCYENAWQTLAFSDHYQQLYGALSNSQMQLQQFARHWRDSQYQQAGLVSLTLFDQLLKQQATLRKANRRQQQQTLHLQQQTDHLQRQLATLHERLEKLEGLPGKQQQKQHRSDQEHEFEQEQTK